MSLFASSGNTDIDGATVVNACYGGTIQIIFIFKQDYTDSFLTHIRMDVCMYVCMYHVCQCVCTMYL